MITEPLLGVMAIFSVVVTIGALIWLGGVYSKLVDSRRYLKKVFGTYPPKKEEAMRRVIAMARELQRLFLVQQGAELARKHRLSSSPELEVLTRAGDLEESRRISGAIMFYKREFWQLRDALVTDGYRLPKTVKEVAELEIPVA